MAEAKKIAARAETITSTHVEQAVVNIGMIGHVDHGKTSLTQALTGKWTDTHSEELKRGISIRLGYADATFYKCEKCKGSEAYTTTERCPVCGSKAVKLRKVSFIDAPGHETLMTTMLSGAALMQGAVLVVAANETCPQPRTIEHLMALDMIGVKNIVVAQNKVDLVDKDAAVRNMDEIKKFLSEFGYGNAPIVPTAAHFGTNIDLLIEAIETAIPTPKPDMSKPLRMCVVRSFDINKPGTRPEDIRGGVLGGSIIHGELKKGDSIEIAPGIGSASIVTKCISLNTVDGEIERAVPGGLIAVGTKLDPALARNDHMRGQVIGKPGTLPKPTTKVMLEVHLVKRLLLKEAPTLRAADAVVLTIGTSPMLGTVVRKTGENSYEFALKAPAIVEQGQKIAISKKDNAQWRLAAYGISREAT